MIRRLRINHRASFGALAVVLPLGLTMALVSRVQVPPSKATGLNQLGVLPTKGAPLRDVIVSVGPLQLRLRMWDAASGVHRILELTPERDPQLPDLLVYWANSEEASLLPTPCVLLGSLAGTQMRRFVLPAEVRAGRLYFYCLGHQELIASQEFDR